MTPRRRGLLAVAAMLGLAFATLAGTALAQQAQPSAAKPVAKIRIVPVSANPADPNVLETVLSDGKTKVQMGVTGLDNVSVEVPVILQAISENRSVPVTKYAWTLTPPANSKAKLSSNSEQEVRFTPDVSGIYKVDLVMSNDAGSGPMASVQIHAGEYIGTGIGNCFQCHPQKTQEWSETGHAIIFQREINGGAEPATSHYAERCIRCHTTGYFIGANNGGFADVQAETGWKFPDLKDIQTGKGQWEAVPVALQNVSNIQCEDCHGPAKDHVTKGAKMAVSLDEGVCNVCHDGGGHHIKGTELRNAKHSDAESTAWNYPTGPDHQDCVRCHSGKGYITFLQNPTNPAAWDNEKQTVSCAVCHDPHSDANKFQLRITGKPVQSVGLTKDFGLSTTCVECHNGRTTADMAARAQFPHYSTAAEMLSDTGGVTYGQLVPNSAHGMVVGQFPVANPDPATSAETPLLYGGAIPGPCVQCHMAPNSLDSTDPNKLKLGEHSFNMVSPDGKAANTTACQPCHQGITSFNLQAKADYDGNGKVEGVEQEVAGLLATLQKAIADSGIKPVKGYPYFDQSNRASWTDKQKNAIYNYLFVRGLEGSDGKANAIHNFKRSVALLQLSYRDLTGKDVPNATIMR